MPFCHLAPSVALMPCQQLTHSTRNLRVAPCMGQGLAMLRFFALPRSAAWPALMPCHACAGHVSRRAPPVPWHMPQSTTPGLLTPDCCGPCRMCVWHPQLPCHPEAGWPRPRLPSRTCPTSHRALQRCPPPAVALRSCVHCMEASGLHTPTCAAMPFPALTHVMHGTAQHRAWALLRLPHCPAGLSARTRPATSGP